jgi:signal peptidase I
MQFVAKDFLTLDVDGTPNDSSATWETERLLVAGELATESLRASGRLRLRVRGESMLPTLWPGDVVEIARCSVEDVRPGEIVLALRDGRFFLHRFVGRSQQSGFLLRGDSMPAADPEFSREALLGRVADSRPLSLWSFVIGRLFSYCGPVLRLGLKLHGRWRWNQNRRSQNPLDAIAVADAEPDLAPARGQECPRYTNLSELPRAGA